MKKKTTVCGIIFIAAFLICSAAHAGIYIKSLEMSAPDGLVVGKSATFTADALATAGETIYYQFDLIPNYGTDNYDPYNNFTTVQALSTSKTCTYSFTEAGSYVMVVKAAASESLSAGAVPIIGKTFTVNSSRRADGNYPDLNSLSFDFNGVVQPGDSVTITAGASSGTGLYYKFHLVPNYGTGSYDPNNVWSEMVEGFTQNNSLTYTFAEAGDYIVVVFVSETQSIPTGATPIIGGSIHVGYTTMTLSSTAFESEGTIPDKYAYSGFCGGTNTSPDLKWTGAPNGTKTFALIMDDPDAPGGTFVHWVLFNIPPTVTSLSEGITSQNLPEGAVQGTNDFMEVGYGGPCPPEGTTHRYYFRIYALDTTLDIASGSTRAQLDAAMQGHMKASAQYMGKYSR